VGPSSERREKEKRFLKTKVHCRLICNMMNRAEWKWISLQNRRCASFRSENSSRLNSCGRRRRTWQWLSDYERICTLHRGFLPYPANVSGSRSPYLYMYQTFSRWQRLVRQSRTVADWSNSPCESGCCLKFSSSSDDHRAVNDNNEHAEHKRNMGSRT